MDVVIDDLWGHHRARADGVDVLLRHALLDREDNAALRRPPAEHSVQEAAQTLFGILFDDLLRLARCKLKLVAEVGQLLNELFQRLLDGVHGQMRHADGEYAPDELGVVLSQSPVLVSASASREMRRRVVHLPDEHAAPVVTTQNDALVCHLFDDMRHMCRHLLERVLFIGVRGGCPPIAQHVGDDDL